MSEVVQFLQLCADEISRRAALATDRPHLSEGAEAFQTALADSSSRSATITTVPVESCLADITPSPLANSLLAANAQIPWEPSQRLDDDGQGVALAVLNRVRDLGHVTCGLMLLGPEHAYPEHSHPPQEIYLPISGDGEWRFGGSEEYRRLDSDELVYNNPGDTHGAAAGSEPLVALYVLWS